MLNNILVSKRPNQKIKLTVEFQSMDGFCQDEIDSWLLVFRLPFVTDRQAITTAV